MITSGLSSNRVMTANIKDIDIIKPDGNINIIIVAG
jgi:hypothetical protein